ncbi:MAG: protein kinase [Candidatus Methylacidiphilales bacterium]|nr:protein kinase [Candidatus Methylacidiphilales bacterium]
MTYADLVPNAQLGHYTIVQHVAEGGMGHVYKGFEASLNREVAIKVLKPELASEKDKLESFDREAQSIAALRHPNIVPIYFVGHQGDLHYFVMPFVSGITLDEWIESETPLSTEQAFWIMTQAIEALEWAYRHNIVHMDIKPSNFLVDDSGVIYLTDFGLAHSLSAPLKSGGDCFGTPAYMSPEQILQTATDQRSDIYSLGASLYHLLTCRFLHDGETVSEIVRGHVEGDFPLAEAQMTGLPPGWIHLLYKMTRRQVGDRYQDYAELRTALEHVDLLGPVTPEGQSTDAPPSVVPVPLRSSLPREELFGILSPKFRGWAKNAIDLGAENKKQEILNAISNPMKPLLLNRAATHLKEIAEVSEVSMTDLADALNALPEIEKFIIELARCDLYRTDEENPGRKKAIKTVGVDLSRQLVLFGIVLRQDFKSNPEFDWHPYWQHAVNTGVIARVVMEIAMGEYVPGRGRVEPAGSGGLTSVLSRHALRKARDQAFLAGLIHGIGKLVLGEIIPFPYYNALRYAMDNQCSLSETETHYFGINHHEAGAAWLEAQRFDSAYRQVALHYGACGQKSPLLASAVGVAHQVAKVNGFGYSGSAVVEFRDLWNCRAWQEVVNAARAEMPDHSTLENQFLPATGRIPLLQMPIYI